LAETTETVTNICLHFLGSLGDETTAPSITHQMPVPFPGLRHFVNIVFLR